MLDVSPEIDRLRPHLGDRIADALIARERREVFSVYPEVRLAAWAGALLVAAAAGIFIKNNFDRLDRVAVAVILGAAAAACYFVASRAKSVVADYVLLLGALLVSADVGYIEQQFDVLGASGVRHLLMLAIFHALTAYRFDSRLVLSTSLASLAAWMGLDRNLNGDPADFAIRAFACAAVVLVWRALNRRPAFARVFEHFAATLVLTGGLLLLDEHPFAAAVITTSVAAAVIAWGFRTRVEAFVLYGFIAALIADVAFIVRYTKADELVILIAILLAIPALVMIHRRFADVSSRAQSRDPLPAEHEAPNPRGSLDSARDDTTTRSEP